MDENLVSKKVGYSINLSTGQVFISEEPFDKAQWITFKSSDLWELIIVPVDKQSLKIMLKKYSLHPLAPSEITFNADHIVSIQTIIQDSEIGRAFIQSKSGIQIVH